MRYGKIARLALWAALLFWLTFQLGPWCRGVQAQSSPMPEPGKLPAEKAVDRPAAEKPAAEKPAAMESKRAALDAAAEPLSIGRVLLEKTNWLGWTFYVAEGTLSVMALSMTLERLFNLRRRKLMPPRFVRRLRDMISRREDRAENLLSLCEGSEAPIANVLRAGILRAGRPLPEVEKALEDALGREAMTQRGRNRMLGVIAAIAPMVGLLGTVVGMILAFRVTSQAGTGKAELLAEGIYLALLRTAFGLVIAVPSLFLAHWFNTRVERIMRDMVDVLEETIPSFAAMERADASGESYSAGVSRSRMLKP
jgi:biopolymer transport protein ExbB